jgi:hypothetical protein
MISVGVNQDPIVLEESVHCVFLVIMEINLVRCDSFNIFNVLFFRKLTAVVGHYQISPNCTGVCLPGYYCPEGSISSSEIMCGEPNRYCPGADYRPTSVRTGYYSIGAFPLISWLHCGLFLSSNVVLLRQQ